MTLPEEYKNTLIEVEGASSDYDVDWAVTGSIGRTLQGMELEEENPDIDIVTDKESLETLHQELQEYSESDISYDNSMEIYGNQLSFHKFEAEIKGVEIEFLGNFEVNDESVYGDYNPNNVEVDGVQIPTVPLEKELEGNGKTGRTEIANRIEDYISEN